MAECCRLVSKGLWADRRLGRGAFGYMEFDVASLMSQSNVKKSFLTVEILV